MIFDHSVTMKAGSKATNGRKDAIESAHATRSLVTTYGSPMNTDGKTRSAGELKAILDTPGAGPMFSPLLKLLTTICNNCSGCKHRIAISKNWVNDVFAPHAVKPADYFNRYIKGLGILWELKGENFLFADSIENLVLLDKAMTKERDRSQC